MTEPLLIFGASARAAAFSALRSGFAPWTADCFADQDLAEQCPTSRIDNYPGEFVELAELAPAAPWLYTGGLENYPRVVHEISRHRVLLGNDVLILQSARDPFVVANVCARAEIAYPNVKESSVGVPRDGGWLCKPRYSAGGQRIHVFRGAQNNDPHQYFQQRIPGVPCSAVYVSSHEGARWIGCTLQLIGPAWTGAGEFTYAGSVGPLDIDRRMQREFRRIGNVLHRRFQLRGLFGVDVILQKHEVWVVEINPRYPASAEILERANQIPLMRWHVDACFDNALSPQPRFRRCCWHGKTIYFTKQPILIDRKFLEWTLKLNARRDWPTVADIPRENSCIAAGRPVITVFASGRSRRDVLAKLLRLVAALKRRLRRKN